MVLAACCWGSRDRRDGGCRLPQSKFWGVQVVERRDNEFVVILLSYQCLRDVLYELTAACCVLVRGRVQLRQDFPGDAALVMTEFQLNDTGVYRCEVVDGLEDKSTSVYLELHGI